MKAHTSPTWLLLIAFALGGSPVDSTASVRFEVESDYQFQPIELRANGETNMVRTVRIQGEYDDNGIGEGTMTFDSRQGLPNEFGDIVARAPGPMRELRIELRRLPVPSNPLYQPGFEPDTLGRERFQITFPVDRINMAFAWIGGETSKCPHLLLIGSLHNTDEFALAEDVTYRLRMGGESMLSKIAPSEPMGGAISLSGIYVNGRQELRQLSIGTDFSGSGTLTLNPNRFGLTWFGEIGMSTMRGYGPTRVSVGAVEMPDPLNRGRKLYRIVSENPLDRNEAVLVLGAYRGSMDHRLLIYRGEHIWTSVWLDDGAWGEGTGQLRGKTGELAPDKSTVVQAENDPDH